MKKNRIITEKEFKENSARKVLRCTKSEERVAIAESVQRKRKCRQCDEPTLMNSYFFCARHYNYNDISVDDTEHSVVGLKGL